MLVILNIIFRVSVTSDFLSFFFNKKNFVHKNFNLLQFRPQYSTLPYCKVSFIPLSDTSVQIAIFTFLPKCRG